MDYYQGVVADYLSADRAMFVNPQCRIQLSPGGSVKKGEHWYCDILAVSLRESTIYLCEVTLSRDLKALITRLREWNAKWPAVCAALTRDSSVDASWPVRPWLFVPHAQRELVSHKVSEMLDPDGGAEQMPMPLVTSLEDIVPWLYTSPHELPSDAETDA